MPRGDGSADVAVSKCRQSEGQKWIRQRGTAQLSTLLDPRACLDIDALSMEVSMQPCETEETRWSNSTRQSWEL